MSDTEQEIGRLTLALTEAEKKAERDYLRFVDADREEIERLREENARYKSTYQQYVEAIDRMNGTPCEQIRHQQEVEALREENARLHKQTEMNGRLLTENAELREENARLREALKPFVEWCANMEAEYPDLDDANCISWNIKMRDIRRAASLVSGYDWTPDE